jgi:hypothetical protein
MTDSQQRRIEFVCTFPSIMSALKVTGDGNGMRIQLDIPETEMGQAARLLLMREKILKVTVEEAETKPKANNTSVRDNTIKRTTAKRRNR